MPFFLNPRLSYVFQGPKKRYPALSGAACSGHASLACPSSCLWEATDCAGPDSGPVGQTHAAGGQPLLAAMCVRSSDRRRCMRSSSCGPCAAQALTC